MYSTVLALHSIIRWLVLLVGIVAAGRALIGWLNNREWTGRDNQLSLFFMIGVDTQVLLGFILYLFLSPLTSQAFSDFAAAMGNDELRYYAVDHIFLMLVALALVHAGRVLARRSTVIRQRHKRTAVTFGLALLAILVAIPWDRPLLRLG